ncbi:branched-chain amino acid ABC transporter permease [Candidatus Korarchaeum cryptofilum]|uniref:Branched-chain amino acid ABC transporter permease n=2 Tax=Candidatus Korarchaeum cryptofilum TaxID=498846 RepID=A0A3R9QPW9_9CREN|nr:branched-chain amino acid ABC transporter permease [Candidatus Korarchaeum cryptofilum]
MRRYLMIAALLLALILPPFLDEFSLAILVQVFMWAYLAMAWDVIGGYGGQFSLGHAAFLGLGAYTSTLLLENFGLTPWVGIWIAGIIAGAAGALVGFASLRLRGPFFALGTIAFAELTQLLLTYLKDITGGPLGIMINETGFEYMVFDKQIYYYYLMLAFAIFGILFLEYFERSKFGVALIALREDEDAAEAVGIDVYRVKVLGAAISAFLTGMGGTLYAQWIHYIRPDTLVRLDFSTQIVAIDVVGGAGSPYGGIIGALILVPISLYLNALFGGMIAGLSILLYGVVLLIVIVLMPGGIYGFLRRFLARRGDHARG